MANFKYVGNRPFTHRGVALNKGDIVDSEHDFVARYGESVFVLTDEEPERATTTDGGTTTTSKAKRSPRRRSSKG